MTAQAALAERVRLALTGEYPVAEKPMFGVRAFMVGDKMVACAQKDGGMLVRVAADRHDELLERPGAAQAVMGPKRRDMGPGWIEVSATAIADDDALSSWLEVALEHNRATRRAGTR